MPTIAAPSPAPLATASRQTEHEVLKRFIVAVVGAPMIIVIVMAGGWILSGALALLAAGGAREFYGLAQHRGIRPFVGFGMLVAAFMILIATLFPTIARAALLLWLVAMSLPLGLAAAVIWRRRPDEQPFATIGVTMVGALWTGGSLVFAIFLRHIDSAASAISVFPMLPDPGAALLLFPVLVTWASDSCAYGVGRIWGRRRLLPRVSPKKTVEGAVAGVAGATLVGVVYAAVVLQSTYRLPLDVVRGGLGGLLIAAVGQVGDMAKSVLKREAGVKDAGRIFPGHGGIIDRFDSLFFALPVAYYFLWWCLST